jgi:hypothetical protein
MKIWIMLAIGIIIFTPFLVGCANQPPKWKGYALVFNEGKDK